MISMHSHRRTVHGIKGFGHGNGERPGPHHVRARPPGQPVAYTPAGSGSSETDSVRAGVPFFAARFFARRSLRSSSIA